MSVKLFQTLTFLAILISSFNIRADISAKLSVEAFSQSELWLKLLLQKPAEPAKSYITSDSFLIHKGNALDPLAELKATIDAFKQPQAHFKNTNDHPQCRFPARLLVIKKYVVQALTGDFPKVQCADYQRWQAQVDAESVSLMFASGYMSNPASMYGHLFIKFNGGAKSRLLESSVNYGAIVPDGENPVVYVLKGILGGYQAGYSDQQFFRHQHNYSDVELRDMWEYKLALEQEDIQLLVAHLWEILPQQFEYYFIDENCAFHFAKLFELFVSQPIINSDSLWVLPSAVMQGMSNVTYKGQPLIKEVSFIESRETHLRNLFSSLSSDKKALVAEIINSEYSFLNPSYLELPSEQKKEITEALLQFIYIQEQKEDSDDTLKKAKRHIFKERLKLPPGKSNLYQPETDRLGPEHSMHHSKFSFGAMNTDNNNLMTSGFRLAYFDDLSPSIGRNEFTNLEMIDIQLASNEHTTKLLRFDLLDLKSLYSPATPWTESTASAWGIRAGYEQLTNDCLDCGVFFIDGNWGKSMKLGENTLNYLLLGGKAFSGKEEDIALYVKAGMISSITSKLKAKLELAQMETLGQVDMPRTEISFEMNYLLAPNWEVRFKLYDQQALNAGFQFNYYWGF